MTGHSRIGGGPEHPEDVCLRAAYVVVPVRERVGVDEERERVERIGKLVERQIVAVVGLLVESGDEGAEQ